MVGIVEVDALVALFHAQQTQRVLRLDEFVHEAVFLSLERDQLAQLQQEIHPRHNINFYLNSS